MSSIVIRDLHDELTLDGVSLSEIRGGLFGDFFLRLSGYGIEDIRGESTDKGHTSGYGPSLG